jgi:hypothetical protein
MILPQGKPNNNYGNILWYIMCVVAVHLVCYCGCQKGLHFANFKSIHLHGILSTAYHALCL